VILEAITEASSADWTSVVAVISGAIAAIAAAVGAVAAWRSAGKSADAARDANRALAVIMFPGLLHHVYQQIADPEDETRQMNRWYMTVWNPSAWDACDVRAEVRLNDGRRFSNTADRIRPATSSPPQRDDDQLIVEIAEMPQDNAEGYGLISETIVRWRDAQGIAAWEARKDWSQGFTPPAAQAVRQIEGPAITLR
jgi:hypothetical protein